MLGGSVERENVHESLQLLLLKVPLNELQLGMTRSLSYVLMEHFIREFKFFNAQCSLLACAILLIALSIVFAEPPL